MRVDILILYLICQTLAFEIPLSNVRDDLQDQLPLILPPDSPSGKDICVIPRKHSFVGLLVLGRSQATLRSIYHHGTHAYPNIRRRWDANSSPSQSSYAEYSWEAGGTDSLRAESRPTTIQRVADRKKESIDQLIEQTRMGQYDHSLSSEWVLDNIPGPNISDKETVLSFARMAANAYMFEPGTGYWKDVST